jgi:hypothetical protein
VYQPLSRSVSMSRAKWTRLDRITSAQLARPIGFKGHLDPRLSALCPVHAILHIQCRGWLFITVIFSTVVGAANVFKGL